jgi:hypothetical protein
MQTVATVMPEHLQYAAGRLNCTRSFRFDTKATSVAPVIGSDREEPHSKTVNVIGIAHGVSSDLLVPFGSFENQTVIEPNPTDRSGARERARALDGRRKQRRRLRILTSTHLRQLLLRR